MLIISQAALMLKDFLAGSVNSQLIMKNTWCIHTCVKAVSCEIHDLFTVLLKQLLVKNTQCIHRSVKAVSCEIRDSFTVLLKQLLVKNTWCIYIYVFKQLDGKKIHEAYTVVLKQMWKIHDAYTVLLKQLVVRKYITYTELY